MISALTGELRKVEDDRVHVQAGAMLYELLIPASDSANLRENVGVQLTFHTLFILSGDPSRGGLEPTLIGFRRPEDRKFFNLFTTVKGIGPRTALKALTVPTSEIAQAIENKDSRFLLKLNGIGKRTAELIIAELSGKTADFAAAAPPGGRAGAGAVDRRPQYEQDAIAGILALGESRISEAQMLLDRAKAANPEAKTTDVLLREMLRLRGSRS
jgi:Holliday junction DNA helicase RuvA